MPNDFDWDRPICIVTNNNIFEIPGYVWCVQNQKQIHRRTKKGSGGANFLFKQSLYEEYDLSIIDSETEGILWLKFSSKSVHGTSFCCCVCYLHQ